MGNLAEAFRDHRVYSKEKKKVNYSNAIQRLIEYDIRFEEGENGFVKVYSRMGVNYHYWPSTGYWCIGKGHPSYSKNGRGIFKLLKELEDNTDET